MKKHLFNGNARRIMNSFGALAAALSVAFYGLVFWILAADSSIPKSKIILGFAVLVLGNICLSLLFRLGALSFVQRPLLKITLAVEQIADGNLNVRIEHDSDDEIGRLAEAIEKLRLIMANSLGAIEGYVGELKNRIDELKFLTEIDRAILNGEDTTSVFDLITENVGQLLEADFCCVALLDKGSQIQVKSLYGFSAEESRELLRGLRGRELSLSVCPSMASEDILLLDDIKNSQLDEDIRQLYDKLGAKAMLAAPLLIDGRSTGSLVVWFKDGREFTDITVNRFKLFADQIAVLIKSANLVDGVRSLTLEVMRALANAIDARDTYTANHSDRVSRFAVALAQELGLSREEIQTIEYAGLLHDIGKIGIDERILNKPDRLTEEEMDIMKSHTTMSADIIRPIEFLKDVVPVVLHHHEWFNGGATHLVLPAGLSRLAHASLR